MFATKYGFFLLVRTSEQNLSCETIHAEEDVFSQN